MFFYLIVITKCNNTNKDLITCNFKNPIIIKKFSQNFKCDFEFLNFENGSIQIFIENYRFGKGYIYNFEFMFFEMCLNEHANEYQIDENLE